MNTVGTEWKRSGFLLVTMEKLGLYATAGAVGLGDETSFPALVLVSAVHASLQTRVLRPAIIFKFR